MVHLIERKIRDRAYAAPRRARAAITRSQVSKAEQRRLLGLVDEWEAEGAARSGVAIVVGAEPEPQPSIASSAIRFETVRHAHSVMRQLASEKRVPLTQLLDDVQAYELSIRQEVERREQNGGAVEGAP